jgi:hypothetical protein
MIKYSIPQKRGGFMPVIRPHPKGPIMVSDFHLVKIVSNHRAASMQQQGKRGECYLARQ